MYLGDHEGGKEEACLILNKRKETWRVKRPILCISTGLEFESAASAAKFYGMFEESVRNSCLLGYLVGKDKVKFKFKDLNESTRFRDTPEGREFMRKTALEASKIAAEKAKIKRELRARS